ncbi:hypothetical protein BOX15_Mlig010594g3 [Macrostomum lignano]|uniref:Uncharacterized protein n=1 Tax=Macrostomum lignano TaxID=282301 RepID=A0A267FRQ5_9PLAT|nr:hypothetical protein BOX15_Mlig010594g3 [Macrostomum lignano]
MATSSPSGSDSGPAGLAEGFDLSGLSSAVLGHLEQAMSPILETVVRDQVHRSLHRIERHLTRRDPAAMQKLFDAYSAGTFADPRNTNQNAQVGPTRFLALPPQQLQQLEQQKQEEPVVFNYNQTRMEQDHIDLRVVEHLKIPQGIALRSLIVPQPPDALFTEDYPDMPIDEILQQQQGFEWLDTNVSNAEQCSRRAMSREIVKQSLDDWVFLYFRVQKRNWESTVVEEKKNAPDVNMYAEDQVHKWTLKLRFKMLRLAPIKMALNAFLSRMGLESNPNIIFCRDGFYGLMDVGNIYGELNKTPCAMISFNSTPKYLGLKNGDGIFVNSVTGTQRQMMEDVPRQEGPKKKAKDQGEGEGEEGEFEFVEEGDEE